MIEIVPAILTNNPEELEKKLALVQEFAGAVQIDICDNRFVKTETVTFEDLPQFDDHIFVEVHLMVESPERHIMRYAELGVDRIIFHIESTNNPVQTAEKIKALGCEVGVALNPDTNLDVYRELDHLVDEVLIMGVVPGGQGREFVDDTLDRVVQLREIYPDAVIGVDGGISQENINLISRSGANIAVIGSAIFDNEDPQAAYREIIKACDAT
jgi:ribulose-phosphate 3-epimerase